jgi:NAD(P)-dependent dehydrogenase (short-subunit alcohol dehydrogenase family)
MRQLDASTSSEACTNSLTFSDSSVASHVRVVMVTSGGGSFAVVTDADQPFSRIHELAYSSSKAALNMLTVRYAQALPQIKFNVATPGEVANRNFAATDMNNHTGELTVTEGTDSIVKLALIGDRCGGADPELHRSPRPSCAGRVRRIAD